jgi:hypothetical protein
LGFACGLGVWFFILEDAVDPSYFNNYQRRLRRRLFWGLQKGWVAAGCIFVPQADGTI